MSRHTFDRMSARERYEFLNDVRPDDFVGDADASRIPTPATVATSTYDQLPRPYQLAVRTYND